MIEANNSDLHGSQTAASGGRSFGALLITMFQGAFVDNVYKFILIMQAAALAQSHAAAQVGSGSGAAFQQRFTAISADYQAVVQIAFILPYVLCVGLASWLSDRFRKSAVTQGTKLFEVFIMGLVLLNVTLGERLYGENSFWIGVGILFLLGVQAALFSPSRYGIMPEILPAERLGWGNGVMLGFYFLAIVLGTVSGPALYGIFQDRLWIPAVLIGTLSVLGMGVSLALPKSATGNHHLRLELNPFPLVLRNAREILAQTGLRWGVMGLMMWWLVATMFQMAAILVATNVMGLQKAQVGLVLLPVVVCQGLGCFLAGYVSRNRLELGLVPFGAAGMCITSLVMWMVLPGSSEIAAQGSVNGSMTIRLSLLMALIALTTGFFIVPLEAFVVGSADASVRGGVWSTSNVLTAFGMMAGAGIVALIMRVENEVRVIFLVAAILMAVTGAILCWRFPRIPLRFRVLCFFRTFYRTSASGLENIPKTGGALLAINHQSYLDGILLVSLIDRPVRFIMSSMVYNTWFVYPFARLTNSIPIEANQSPRELIRALRAASEEIRNGGLIGIFPEGQLTRTGQMMPFRRGIERIMQDVHAPVLPVAIDGAWDTAMAPRGGRLDWRRALGWGRGRLAVVIGKSVPTATPLYAVRQIVQALQAEAFATRREVTQVLHREALAVLRSSPFARLCTDVLNTEPMPNWKLATAAVALASALKKDADWVSSENVGLLVPPSIAGVSLNLGALLAGRVPVNLNYTTSRAVMEQTCQLAGIRLIVSSRQFVEKAGLELPQGIRVVYLEDLRTQITGGDRRNAMLAAMLMPVGRLERWLGRAKPAALDDTATLIFSSGSTGVPKGVMLTHWNIVGNIAGFTHVVEIQPQDRMLGILPFFHSFGFTATMWLPMLRGIGASYHPNPLDAKAVGAIVARDRVTIMVGTPTFISLYTRRVEPGEFGSLRLVVVGAEKLKSGIAQAFRERFGIEPREGYGATETSPVISLNTFDYREPGIYQCGTRNGTVGHPVPGCVTKVVHLDSGEVLPPGEPGMLLIKGVNVMKGYFGQPEKTAEVLQDGWYRTGDVAKVDEDGFITITDRLSRFSKIGGEMVPHIRIEELLQQASGVAESVFAVTGITDEKKGERLAVLYTLPEGKAREACDSLSKPELSLPAIWIPKWADFAKVDAIPVLGTGKMDLRGIKDLAIAALSK